jgi:hypothetical protein
MSLPFICIPECFFKNAILALQEIRPAPAREVVEAFFFVELFLLSKEEPKECKLLYNGMVMNG